MPFTFFAHQAFVIPLKIVRPRWFDGTALCVGSMAPDLAYAFMGTPLDFRSHSLLAQVVWTVPLSLGLTRLIRDAIADPVGAHVPAPLGPEIRALSLSRHSRWVSATSALIGGFSHIFVDGFTHRSGWAAHRIPWLRSFAFYAGDHPVSVARVMQYVGHSFGTAIGFALLAWLMTRGRLTSWNLPARVTAAPRPTPRFWWPFALSCVLGLPLGVASVSITGGGLSPMIIRAAWVMFAGLWLSARSAALAELPAERTPS